MLRSAGVLASNAADLTDTTYAALNQTTARSALTTWLTANVFNGQSDAASLATAEADRQLSLSQAIRSAGDVTLNAGTFVFELGSDADVDLMADQLTVTSRTGITGIELGVNELTSIQNITSGSIVLTDVDSLGDSNPGLNVVNVTNAGLIDISTAGDFTVAKVVATGASSDVRLSSAGVLTTIPVNGLAKPVSAGHDLALDAVGNLVITAGITAPNRVHLGSEATIDTSNVTLNLSTQQEIAIESSNSLKITGTLASATGVRLVSNGGDVNVAGTISGLNGGSLASLTVIARGNLVKDGTFSGQYRFRSWTDGNTYYSNTAELASDSLVVDSAGLPVANFALKDLVPWITAEAASVTRRPMRIRLLSVDICENWMVPRQHGSAKQIHVATTSFPLSTKRRSSMQ
jgi:hypothetical protein